MMLVIGDGVDARGFALAGAAVIRCRTRDDVMSALGGHGDGGRPVPRFVLVSASAYALARAEVDELRDRRGGPVVLVLPETAGET